MTCFTEGVFFLLLLKTSLSTTTATTVTKAPNIATTMPYWKQIEIPSTTPDYVERWWIQYKDRPTINFDTYRYYTTTTKNFYATANVSYKTTFVCLIIVICVLAVTCCLCYCYFKYEDKSPVRTPVIKDHQITGVPELPDLEEEISNFDDVQLNAVTAVATRVVPRPQPPRSYVSDWEIPPLESSAVATETLADISIQQPPLPCVSDWETPPPAYFDVVVGKERRRQFQHP